MERRNRGIARVRRLGGRLAYSAFVLMLAGFAPAQARTQAQPQIPGPGVPEVPESWVPALDVLVRSESGGPLRLVAPGAPVPAVRPHAVQELGDGPAGELGFALYRLTDGPSHEAWSAAPLPAARVAELLDRHGGPAPTWAGRAPLDGSARALRSGELVHYLRSIRSELAEGVSVAVPVQDVVVDGEVASLWLRPGVDGRIGVGLALRRTDVLWPMRDERTPRGNVQLPAVRTERFLLQTRLRPGEGRLFGGGGEEASRWLLVLGGDAVQLQAAPLAEAGGPAPELRGRQLEVVFGTLPFGERIGDLADPEVVAGLRAVCGDPLLLPMVAGERAEAAFGIRQACVVGYEARVAPGVAVLDPVVGSVWVGVELRAELGEPVPGRGEMPLELAFDVAWPSIERRGGVVSGIEGVGVLDLPQHDVGRVRVTAGLQPGADWVVLEIAEIGTAVGRLVVLGRLRGS